MLGFESTDIRTKSALSRIPNRNLKTEADQQTLGISPTRHLVVLHTHYNTWKYNCIVLSLRGLHLFFEPCIAG